MCVGTGARGWDVTCVTFDDLVKILLNVTKYPILTSILPQFYPISTSILPQFYCNITLMLVHFNPILMTIIASVHVHVYVGV